MTDETFAVIVKRLQDVFGERLEDGRLQAWREILDVLEDAEAIEAVRRVCRSVDRFKMITPATIINAARGDPRDVERLLDEEAELAVNHLE